jgi:hypothetical protein
MRAPILKSGQQPLAYSIPEAARMCACRPFHIRRALKFFELEGPISIGRRSVVLHSALLAWLQSRPRTKSPRKKKETPHADQ